MASTGSGSSARNAGRVVRKVFWALVGVVAAFGVATLACVGAGLFSQGQVRNMPEAQAALPTWTAAAMSAEGAEVVVKEVTVTVEVPPMIIDLSNGAEWASQSYTDPALVTEPLTYTMEMSGFARLSADSCKVTWIRDGEVLATYDSKVLGENGKGIFFAAYVEAGDTWRVDKLSWNDEAENRNAWLRVVTSEDLSDMELSQEILRVDAKRENKPVNVFYHTPGAKPTFYKILPAEDWEDRKIVEVENPWK